MRIEQGRPGDVDAVRSISKEAFSAYGDYAELVPRFFSTQGVHSCLAWDRDRLLGFVLIGFLPWDSGDGDRDWWVADLLAVAVVPDRRRRGIGSRLVDGALGLVAEMSGWRDVKEIRLTCAASNEAGLAFFARHGFSVIDRKHGTYSGGQKAWRLAMPVSGTGTGTGTEEW